MTIGRKLTLGFAGLVALTGLLSVTSLRAIGRLKENFDTAVEETARKIGCSYGVLRQRIFHNHKDLLRTVRTPASTRAINKYGVELLQHGRTPQEAAKNIREKVVVAKAAARVAAINAKNRQREQVVLLEELGHFAHTCIRMDVDHPGRHECLDRRVRLGDDEIAQGYDAHEPLVLLGHDVELGDCGAVVGDRELAVPRRGLTGRQGARVIRGLDRDGAPGW